MLQWEYQTDPLPPLEAADTIHLARYILIRLAELQGVRVTFDHPTMTRDTPTRISMHANFSTKASRAEGGITYISTGIFNTITLKRNIFCFCDWFDVIVLSNKVLLRRSVSIAILELRKQTALPHKN